MSFERVVVLGGCHVNGFPVGERHSFVTGVLNELSLHETQCVIVASVSAKRLESSLASVPPIGPRDLVILQLGNFETLAPMMFGKSHSAHAVDQVAKAGSLEFLSSTGRLAGPLTWLTRSVGNGGLFLLREFIGQPAFSSDEFSRQLSQPSIGQALSKAGTVVVVGALPTRVRIRNVYRRRANVVLATFARQGGYQFVDYLQAIRGNSFSSVTIDPIHLNINGHKILTDEIMRSLNYVSKMNNLLALK